MRKVFWFKTVVSILLTFSTQWRSRYIPRVINFQFSCMIYLFMEDGIEKWQPNVANVVCECCLRTNTNWHSLRTAQHRIDSNYFVLVCWHFRISSQANTNILKCSKHSYWPCESILFVLRRIASPNVGSIRVSSYWFVSHRCTFVSIRCTFALGFADRVCCDSVRCNTMRNDRIVVSYRTCSHWFV